MSLYNEYLPSQNVQALHDVYQHLQIPSSSTSIYGVMTDQRVQGQGAPSTPRPNNANPALQTTQRQSSNTYVLSAQASDQQQNLQYGLQYRQDRQTPRDQTLQTHQYSDSPSARQPIRNGQMSYSGLPISAQQFSPQAQNMNIRQHRTPRIHQAQQFQQLATAASYVQAQIPQSIRQYPSSFNVGISQNCMAAYPNQAVQDPETYRLQQPIKRPLPYSETSPSPKRVRGASHVSPVSAIGSPELSPHGHPNQRAERLSTQQERFQFDQQRINQQAIEQQIRQWQIAKQQQAPSTPYRSPSVYSNHSLQKAGSSATNAGPQKYPTHADLRKSAGSSLQGLQTAPPSASPGIQQPHTHMTQTTQPSRTDVTLPTKTTISNLEQSRQKMLKSGFIKTSSQPRKPQTANRRASSVVPKTEGLQQMSQQASVIPSPAPSASLTTQHSSQQRVERSSSVIQPATQHSTFPVYKDTMPELVYEVNRPYFFGIAPSAEQVEAQRHSQTPMMNSMPATGSHILRRNLTKQNANLAQHPQTLNSPPVAKQPQFRTTGVSAVPQANTRPSVPAPSKITPDQNVIPTPADIASRSLRAPSPKEKEWATYAVNRAGARLLKSQPPPQGTYHAPTVSGYGSEARDYSDPRDFYAPTAIDRTSVWHALGPTRDSYFKITGVKLERGDLRCLELGYNAAWDEIKRHAISWIFDNYSPDPPPETKSGPDQGSRVEMKLVADKELPGYSGVEVEVEVAGVKLTESSGIAAARRARKAEKYFEDGQLIFDPEKSLFRLRRWYGQVDSYHFAPNWPGVRLKNRAGINLQNPEAFACNNCRESGRLCYGHKEHVDRKCAPCQEFGLECSKEENYLERESGKLERVKRTPQSRNSAFAEELKTKYQTVQRSINARAAEISTKPEMPTTNTTNSTNMRGKPAGAVQPPQRRGRFGQRRDWMK